MTARVALGAGAAAPAGPARAGAAPIAVPSGLRVELIETLWDEQGGLWLRLRFLAPDIAVSGFERVQPDFRHLCETVALPLIARDGRAVDLIVISYSDRVLKLGQSDPEAVQFFEAFRPDGTACAWEAF